jgi:(3S)-malyl-CoA thioesterase
MSTVYDTVQRLKFVRSALYVPASNARALEKARGLDADMLMIDLEDAVAQDAKDAARAAAIAFVKQGAAGKFVAIRVNAPDSGWFDADAKALKDIKVDALVLPKVESLEAVKRACNSLQTPVIAMIETPEGLYAAREIAGHPRVSGLIAGVNDISELCGIQPGPQRQGLELSLQMIVLAAASAAKPAFDGVCNRLDDMTGFTEECAQGRCYGFAGKTLIHPNQIAPANLAFSPSEAEVEDAKALLAEAKAGAARFRGRMIEAMHVRQAELTVERASYAINGLA